MSFLIFKEKAKDLNFIFNQSMLQFMGVWRIRHDLENKQQNMISLHTSVKNVTLNNF